VFVGTRTGCTQHHADDCDRPCARAEASSACASHHHDHRACVDCDHTGRADLLHRGRDLDSSVTLTFLSADLTGALSTGGAVFTLGGTIFNFIVTGVAYSGSATTTSLLVAGGLVSQVVVSPTNGGITVEVKLSELAGHYTFGLGHSEVGALS